MGGRAHETEVRLRAQSFLPFALENFSHSVPAVVFPFFALFICLIFTSHDYLKSNLGSFSAQLECGMAELVRIRKKRLQIPITR